MTSYFEIGGQIIEVLDDSNDIQFGLGRVSATEHRAARAENKEVSRAFGSMFESRNASSPGKDSFLEHAWKTGTHNIRAFGELGGKRKIALLKNPHLIAIWGIGQTAEVIGMHYDYFVKGESHPY